jgi:hypothetical protein
MNLFLTDEEVADLTGYKQASKQVAMLRRQGVPFHVNASGHPKVARAIVEGLRASEPAKPKQWSPSWAGSQQ